MAKAELKQKDTKKVGVANFETKDFMVVKLNSGKVTMVHKIQGAKLVKEKKATEVKDVEIQGRRSKINVVDLKEGK